MSLQLVIKARYLEGGSTVHAGSGQHGANFRRCKKVIVNTAKINVPSENRRELFQTISPLLEPIRSEHGCLAYGCYVDLSDENKAVLIGEWETWAALNDHLRSKDCAILFGAIKVLSSPAGVIFKFFYPVERDKEDINSKELP